MTYNDRPLVVAGALLRHPGGTHSVNPVLDGNANMSGYVVSASVTVSDKNVAEVTDLKTTVLCFFFGQILFHITHLHLRAVC